MRKLAMLLGLLTAALGSTPVDAADFTMSPPSAADQATPEILNGRKVLNPERDWPATFKFNSGIELCTATVIGPRVVLTAAHCLPENASGDIKVGLFSTTATCKQHDAYGLKARYVDAMRWDVALCVSRDPIQLPGTDSAYETLDTSAMPPAKTQILLLGYGCRQELGHGPAGVLYEGDSVIRVSDPGDPWMESTDGAAVCGGDSGGAAFRTPSAESKKRYVIAVNSHGDLFTRSMLTAVAQSKVAKFIADWRTTNGVQICGLDKIPGCHD